MNMWPRYVSGRAHVSKQRSLFYAALSYREFLQMGILGGEIRIVMQEDREPITGLAVSEDLANTTILRRNNGRAGFSIVGNIYSPVKRRNWFSP